jgi:hypothetical protein
MTAVKSFLQLGCVAVAAAIAGCAHNGACAKVQPYESARSVPPIQGVDGLQIPESATAMKVPNTVAGPDVPYGVKIQDPKKPGKTRYQCLDQPPTMPAMPASEKSPT